LSHLPRRASSSAAICLAFAVAAVGCIKPTRNDRDDDKPLPALPTWEVLSSQYNRRIEKLEHLASRGTVSLTWRDEEGKDHNEPQVDLRLWLHLPRDSALSMEKLGERYFWIGSDDTQFWMFDFSREPSRLTVGMHEDFASAETPLGLHPLTLLDLLGFSPLPADARPIRHGEPAGAIIVESVGRSGRVNLTLQAHTFLPVHVEAINEDNEVVLTSDMREFKSAFLPGTNVLEHPKVPGLFDIRDTAGTLHIRAQLQDPTCEVQGQPYDRMFDLKQLTDFLQPAEIHRLEPAPAAEREPAPPPVSSGDESP
jgi:hypothetical protein